MQTRTLLLSFVAAFAALQPAAAQENGSQGDVAVTKISAPLYIKKGESTKISFQTYNAGMSSALCEYVVNVNKEKVGEVTNCYVSQGYWTLDVSINVSSELPTGQDCELEVALKSVNGAAPTGDTSNDSMTKTIRAYDETVARQKHLIEYHTATWCTYCPRGSRGITRLKQQRDDIACVSLHNQDEYSLSEDAIIQTLIKNTGIPTCAVNRSTFDDYGALGFSISWTDADALASYLGEYADSTAKTHPSFCHIDILSSYDKSTRKLDITVKGSGVAGASRLMSDDLLTVYVTQDGTMSYEQDGVTYSDNYYHHGTIRKIASKNTGDTLEWSGDSFEKTYSLTLDRSWDTSQMHIVAFTARPFYDAGTSSVKSDKKTVWVSQTNRVALGQSTTDIRDIADGNADKALSGYYSINGQRLKTLRKGVNIIRYADGTAHKVYVK